MSLYFGAVGQILELPTLAQIKEVAYHLKPLPYTLDRSKQAKLTPDGIARLTEAIQAATKVITTGCRQTYM